MRGSTLFFLIVCYSVTTQQSFTQQASANVMTILRASLAAQTGNVAIQDTTLSGSVEYIVGSDDETVPFSFKGTLSGSSRTDISLSSGTFTETYVLSSSGTTGNWSVGGGTPHPIAGHNLMTDAAWCFPLFVIERLLSNPSSAITYVGTENGLAHFSAYQVPPTGTPSTLAALPQHLSQIDLFLDPVTFLPNKLSFTVHPDNDALIDIPIAVQFSEYQAANGIMLPMRIQKFMNNSLMLDIRVQSTMVNSGLPQTIF